MKRFTLLLVLILLTACTSRSGRLDEDRITKTVVQSIISTDDEVNNKPYIKVIAKVLVNAVGRVAVIEIEGKRYIIQSGGGILEITE